MDYLTSPTSRHSREAKTLIDFLLPSAPGQPSGAMAAVVYTNYLIPSLFEGFILLDELFSGLRLYLT